jgi:hypothetical protein
LDKEVPPVVLFHHFDPKVIIHLSPMATPSKVSPLGFLDLPTEIRIEIYRHLFTAAEIIVPATPPLPPVVCSGGFQRHVLNTCWTIRNEALSYLMAATTLQICQPLDETVPIPPCYLENIPRLVVSDAKAFSRRPFKPERLPALQVLELRNITIWCKYHPESFFLEGELGSSTMYGLALYNINRISPVLTKMIHEKERTYRIRLLCQFVVSSASHDTIVRFSPHSRLGIRVLNLC